MLLVLASAGWLCLISAQSGVTIRDWLWSTEIVRFSKFGSVAINLICLHIRRQRSETTIYFTACWQGPPLRKRKRWASSLPRNITTLPRYSELISLFILGSRRSLTIKVFGVLQGGCMVCDGRDDARDFNRIRLAMKTLTFSEDQFQEILKLLAAILHLGNVSFEGERLYVKSSKNARSSHVFIVL